MNAKHTPGPWKVEERKHVLGTVITYGTVIIAQVFCWGKKPSDKMRLESKANAALIAAAPDMKFALDFALCHNDNPEAWPEALEHIKKAIAKAEGK